MSYEFIASMIALAGLIVTISVFIFQMRQNVRLQKADFVYRLNDKYDCICQMRSANPELADFDGKWVFKPVPQMTKEEKEYFFFAGMTIGFFEIAVYSSRIARILSERDVEDFVVPMMEQEIRWNLPIFRHFAKNNMMSTDTRDIVQSIIDLTEQNSARCDATN